MYTAAAACTVQTDPTYSGGIARHTLGVRLGDLTWFLDYDILCHFRLHVAQARGCIEENVAPSRVTAGRKSIEAIRR